MATLEGIVARMESSELPLEAVIDAYEEGARLLAVCEARIANARQRVEKIGAMGTVPVPMADDGRDDLPEENTTKPDELF